MSTPTPSETKREIIGNALMLSGTIFFGINVPVMKILIPQWLSAIEVTAFRFLGCAALMWLVSIFIKGVKIEKQDWKQVIAAGVLVWGFLLLFAMAFNWASPIDISIIMILPPIIVVVINAFFRHMKVGGLEWVGIVISFAGAAALILLRHAGANGSHNLIGELCALGSSLCYALYLIVLEKPSQKYPSISLMRWVMLIAGILCLPCIGALPHSGLFMHPKALPIGLICFTVVLATFYAYMITPPSIKMIGSEMVSMYQYLIPVIAAIASVIMKVDKLVWYQPLSMGIIILGVVLANISKRKIAKKQEANQRNTPSA